MEIFWEENKMVPHVPGDGKDYSGEMATDPGCWIPVSKQRLFPYRLLSTSDLFVVCYGELPVMALGRRPSLSRTLYFFESIDSHMST